VVKDKRAQDLTKPTGRPRKPVDLPELEKLASLGCTMKEMGYFFDVSVDTLERNYADVIDKGREAGKRSVRRIMWKQAENGNTVALKYLVHNVLKEKIEDNSDKDLTKATNDVFDKLNTISTDMILKLVKNDETA